MKLNQFYTKPYVAKFCWNRLQSMLGNLLDSADLNNLYYIEPSAGRGDFFDLTPPLRLVSILTPKIETTFLSRIS